MRWIAEPEMRVLSIKTKFNDWKIYFGEKNRIFPGEEKKLKEKISAGIIFLFLLKLMDFHRVLKKILNLKKVSSIVFSVQNLDSWWIKCNLPWQIFLLYPFPTEKI